MIEKSPDYVFSSALHVVNPHGLGVVGDMVTRLPLRENETCSNVSLLLYLILIIMNLTHLAIIIAEVLRILPELPLISALILVIPFSPYI